jgi:hypothetical protein
MKKDYELLRKKAKNIKSKKYYVIDTKGEMLSRDALEIVDKYKVKMEALGIKVYLKESLKIKDEID